MDRPTEALLLENAVTKSVPEKNPAGVNHADHTANNQADNRNDEIRHTSLFAVLLRDIFLHADAAV